MEGARSLRSVSLIFSTETTFVGPGPQFGGQCDSVSDIQGMDLTEVVVGTPIVGRQAMLPFQMLVSSKCPTPRARVLLPVPGTP
mgnify:CR=1 FL=1